MVREKEFAKQLRLARYLAASSLPPSRPLKPASVARTPKQPRPVRKARSKAKAEPARKEAGEAELAKENAAGWPGGSKAILIRPAARGEAAKFAGALDKGEIQGSSSNQQW